MGVRRWDTVIVGASSAGLYTAYLLASSGQRVAVFEQHPNISPARRTLIITPHLRRVLPFPFDEAILHTTPIMAVAGPTARAEIHLVEADLIVERGALIRLLRDKAQGAGAEIILGHKLVGIEANGHRARLVFRDRKHNRQEVALASAIVGADGVFSDTARFTGIRRPPSVPILQAEIDLPSGWDPKRVQVWFDRSDTRFFYWLIPESERRGVLGLVADSDDDIRALLVRFLRKRNIEPLTFQGARVAMHDPRLRPWGRVGSAPVYLVGDAAGQVKVTTVGGSVTGFVGAQAAAEALITGIPYAQTIKPLKRELDLHWWVRRLLDRLDNEGYDALIRGLTPRVRRFLETRTRDEMAGALWPVLLTTPSLWRVGPHLLRGWRPGPKPSSRWRDEYEVGSS